MPPEEQEEKISMLELRQHLTEVANEVLFQKKRFIVVKNKNIKFAFLISPLEENKNLKKTSTRLWKSLINRSKFDTVSLEEIRVREKKRRK